MKDDDTTHTGHVLPGGGTPRSTSASAYLIVITGPGVGEMHRLGPATTVVGRGEAADLRLVDDGVSRRHAAIVVEGADVLLRDLGSANGTCRNGQRITDAVTLTDGDKISMGATTILKFTYQDDVDERFQKNLYESVVRDGLTQVFNRRYLDEHLRSEFLLSSRHLTPLALILVDIDHFKRINDQYGHQTGDHVLRALGKRLSSGVREEDIVARYGGEEFAVLCRQTDAAQALALAERLRLLVAAEPITHRKARLPVTISAGIAAAPADEITTERDLVKGSDGALYEAKRRGRNRTVLSCNGATGPSPVRLVSK